MRVYIMSFAMSDPSDPVVLRVDPAGEAVRVAPVSSSDKDLSMG